MWQRARIILISLFLSNAIHALESRELSRVAVNAPHSLLMDIKQILGGRLVAVGERGHILISDDNGNAWRQIQVPTNTLLTKLFFITDKVGWAVGHQQMILKTEDAGETWKVQNESDSLDQPAIFDIWFSDASNGVAVGAYGLFLTTDDGGDNWQEVYQDALEDYEIGFPHFYSVAFEQKSKKLFMASELGMLAVSNDLGKTWEKLASPYEGSFFHISALPNGYLVAMGLRGHLFRSLDSGLSWQSYLTNQNSVIMTQCVIIMLL